MFSLSLILRGRILATQDLYLHITVGRWISEHHLVPDKGIFSGTMADAPWLAHEWLASLGLATLYDHLGWSGVAAAAALLLALAIAIVAHEVARTAGPIWGLGCAATAWGLCLIHLLARPHMATLPLFALWIAAHIRARRKDSVPFYLVPIMILWVNLHGGFLIGPAFTLVFAAEAVYAAPSFPAAIRAALRWGAFLAAALAAALVSPHGVAGLLFPIELTHMSAALAGVTEWQPSSLANNPALFIWLLLFVFMALHLELRIALTRLVMFLILTYLALAHLRHTELLALGAPLLFQDALAARRPADLEARISSLLAPHRRAAVTAIAALFLALPLTSIAVLGRNPEHGADRFTPEKAVDWVLAQRPDGPVLNSYNFGGYLIFRGIAPFIDGRVEVYGEDFVTRYLALSQFPALLDRYHIAWTIFEPDNSRAIMLSHMPGWHLAYADAVAQIHVRDR